ncbi:hypothetical protein P7K49_023356 [Saguinus oedipus]|uniref:Uncharacterized protein n=1 Tax=Saguinus oedipus TaxID=9490 RepID=A0ABQ9UM75_SAGOE|nr:hypothetical protein P7K49_023356 [Saguinus oedipus]
MDEKVVGGWGEPGAFYTWITEEELGLLQANTMDQERLAFPRSSSVGMAEERALVSLPAPGAGEGTLRRR